MLATETPFHVDDHRCYLNTDPRDGDFIPASFTKEVRNRAKSDADTDQPVNIGHEVGKKYQADPREQGYWRPLFVPINDITGADGPKQQSPKQAGLNVRSPG
jgi:hypothetical protein